MALEVLKGVEEIGGFRVVDMGSLKDKNPEKFNESGAMDYKWFEKDVRPYNFIYVRRDVNSIAFTIQNGPVKEVGVNGCQITTLIESARLLIEKHNEKFPSMGNISAMHHLEMAIFSQERRAQAREARGVEGTGQA